MVLLGCLRLGKKVLQHIFSCGPRVPFKFLNRQRGAEQIALKHVTAKALQKFHLLLAFYPLGDGLKPKAACQCHDCASDGGIVRVVQQVHNKGSLLSG